MDEDIFAGRPFFSIENISITTLCSAQITRVSLSALRLQISVITCKSVISHCLTDSVTLMPNLACSTLYAATNSTSMQLQIDLTDVISSNYSLHSLEHLKFPNYALQSHLYSTNLFGPLSKSVKDV